MDNKPPYDKSKLIFFLGGHDAEMLTIKELLLNNQIPKESILDKDLNWGVKLSEYKDELSKLSEEQISVFIELIIDDKNLLPLSFKVINHHNEYSGTNIPTSLEQIAELLQTELTEDQKLVSEYDRGFVRALKQCKSPGKDAELTDKEIKEIIAKDKKAQGVTDRDEELAEKSIRDLSNLIDNDIIIVHSLTNRTIPILEKLYFKYEGKLEHIFIIYKDEESKKEELNYSGKGEIINQLHQIFNRFKDENNLTYFWWGGELPDFGYFGSNRNLTEEEIIRLVERPIYSQHIFLFPFTFGFDDGKDYFKIVKDELETGKTNWKPQPFEINNKKKNDRPDMFGRFEYDEQEIWKYNEYNYFYPAVRKAIFSKDGDSDSKYFDWEIHNKSRSSFQIELKKNTKNYRYLLEIDNISLRLFKDDVGILSITLLNKYHPEFDSVLAINDFGRRIYPQYLGKYGSEDTKNTFLPKKVELFIDGDKFSEEEFKTDDFFKMDTVYVNYINKLLDPINKAIINHKNKNEDDKLNLNCKFRTILDDRMYTISWYGNNALINKLGSRDEKGDFIFENSRDWYMYIFLDSVFAGIGNNKMRKKLIEESTYSRFIEDGTLYGLTRYSFVCITGINDTAYNIIRNHTKKMYYNICALLLIQRASLIKFSQKIRDISRKLEEDLVGNKKNIKTTFDKLEKLDSEINLFINTLHFDEVTAQEQGIEIYDLAKKNMGIEKIEKSLKSKIQDIYSIVNSMLNRETNDRVEKTGNWVAILTAIGTIFIPLTFFAALWAMDVYFLDVFHEENYQGHWWFSPVTWLVNAIYFMIVLTIFYFTKILIESLNQSKR